MNTKHLEEIFEDITKDPVRDVLEIIKGDRNLCNCGQAFYTWCSDDPCAGQALPNGVTDHESCRGGCSSNQLDSKKEIAEYALALQFHLAEKDQQISLLRYWLHAAVGDEAMQRLGDRLEESAKTREVSNGR